MQMRVGASHFTVTVPSTSLSQKHEPEMLSPQSAFCMMMQLAMNLKFLFTFVIFFKIQDYWQYYIIAYLVGPDLSLVYIVVFVGEVAADHGIDLFLHEGTNIVEDCLLLLAHCSLQFINTESQNSYCNQYIPNFFKKINRTNHNQFIFLKEIFHGRIDQILCELLGIKIIIKIMQVLCSRANINKQNNHSQPTKQLHRLRVELNDKIFELKKQEEDHAQQKAKIYLQLQKEKSNSTRIIKDLRDKLKEENETWARKIDEIKLEQIQAIQAIEKQYSEKSNASMEEVTHELSRRHQKQIRQLKSQLTIAQNNHRRSEEQWKIHLKNTVSTLNQAHHRQDLERERKSTHTLNDLKRDYDSKIVSLQKIYLQQELIRHQAQSQLQNTIKNHVKQRIIWQRAQNQYIGDINHLKQTIFNLQQEIIKLNKQMNILMVNHQQEKQKKKDEFESRIKELSENYENKIEEGSSVFNEDLNRMQQQLNKMVQIHRRKQQSWHQTGKMVLQLYQKRQSKKQDVKTIQKLQVQLIKKDFMIERQRKQLQHCKLQLQNMQQIYDRIFIFNSRVNNQKSKSYQIKKLKTQMNQSNRSTIISDKNIGQKRYIPQKNE